MLKGLVDPGALAPPAGSSALPWVARVREWSAFLRKVDQELFAPMMSTSAQAALASALGGISGVERAIEREAVPVSAVDLMKLIEGIRARSRVLSESLDPPAMAVNSVSVEPSYVAESLNDNARGEFESDIAHIAVAADFSAEPSSGVISATTSWSEPVGEIDVRVELDVWELGGEVSAVPADRAQVAESLPVWLDPDDVYAIFDGDYGKLLAFPEIAIEVAYRKLLPVAERRNFPLTYSIGPKFVSSIDGIGFGKQGGRLATVFRSAAQVACGRASSVRSLSSRPYRRAAGGNAKDQERADGAKLMRGTLGTGPDAARIMWWEGPCPELLGVVSHDGDPLSLTQ